jgi:hypothetical protein
MKKFSTIDQIDAWTEVASQLGYTIRYDHFGGTGGGLCEFGSTRALFMDVSLSSLEQLERLEQTIGLDPLIGQIELPESIKSSLAIGAETRRAA